MTITLDAFMWTCGILLTVIIALIGFIVNYILKSQAASAKSAENAINSLKVEFSEYKTELTALVNVVKKEQDEIKFNYLKRFEIVNDNVHNTKEEIIGKIHDLHTVLIQSIPKNNG